MKIVHQDQAKFFKNSESCDAFEYDLRHVDLGAARVKVCGRYPDHGRVSNAECQETAYILAGSGTISIENTERGFSAGDVILIERGERYFWQGEFAAFLFSTPAWSAEQCRELD